MRLLMITAVLAAACGPGNDHQADGGADADADADADAGEVDCGGTDTLDVKVVRDHARFADDEPRPGATVVVDCAAGRMRATTDDQGLTHFTGLDFAHDPPDVSAVVAGLVMRTRASLGHDGEEVPRPFVFDLPEPEGGAASFPWETTAQSVSGEIVRTTPGSEVYCWCAGSLAWPRHHWGLPGQKRGFLGDAPRYDVPLFEELTPARAACLELGEGEAGPRTLLGFGEAEIDGPGEGPPIVLRALDPETEIQRAPLSIRHIGGDQDPYLAGREVAAFIDDQDPDSYAVAIGVDESGERVGDLETLQVAWVPGVATGRPVLTLSMAVEGGAYGWSVLNTPLEADACCLGGPPTFEVKPPPRVAVAEDGAGRTMGLRDADWAQDAMVVITVSGREYWRVMLPAGLGDWQMPAPPDDSQPPSLGSQDYFVGAYRYDEPPPADNMIADWASQHLREVAAGRQP